jgi:hypothetical protein
MSAAHIATAAFFAGAAILAVWAIVSTLVHQHREEEELRRIHELQSRQRFDAGMIAEMRKLQKDLEGEFKLGR